MISNTSPKHYTPIERSRKTCYNCRIKRKKCDMIKPTCTRCLKSKSNKECIWPENGESVMPKKFIAPKLSKFRIIPSDYNNLSKPTDSDMKSSSPTSENEITLVPQVSTEVSHIDFYDDNMKTSLFNFDQNFIFPLNSFPNESVRMNHPIFLACVPEFMGSTSPQYTHQSLTVLGLCGKYFDSNDIARTVSMAGGCQYLSWKYLELSSMALQSYKYAKKKLYDFIDQNRMSLFVNNDDNWVLSCAMYLLVTALLKHSVNKSSVVNNILTIYQLLRKKLAMTPFSENCLTVSSPSFDENVLIYKDEIDSTTLENLKFNKFISESFIYHYGTTILVSNDYKKLPNPVQIFNDFRGILKTHMIETDVSWMNNPILGACSKSFEIYCKSSYLFRVFIDINTTETNDLMVKAANVLITEVNNHETEKIPYKIKNSDPENFSKLQNSVLTSNIFLASSMILLRNIETPLVNEFDEKIQQFVKEALYNLANMTHLAMNKMLIGFPLFIVGCCCINEHDRRMVLRELNEIGEITHGYRIFTMVKALNIAWGVSYGVVLNESQGLGIRTLISKDVLESIS